MSEWHLSPDYIINNWTDELFDLMVEKLVDRKKKESGVNSDTKKHQPTQAKVSDKALFHSMGKMVKVVKQ